MGLRHVDRQWKQRPFKSYYQWVRKGKVTSAVKFLWTGIWTTGLLTFNWEITVFIIIFGFIFREFYCSIVNPEYEGHPLLR